MLRSSVILFLSKTGKEGGPDCAKPLSPAKELVRRAGRRRQGGDFRKICIFNYGLLGKIWEVSLLNIAPTRETTT